MNRRSGRRGARSRWWTHNAIGLAGPGGDRVQAQTARAGLPARPRGVLPQPAVERERGAAVAALEEHAGVAARVDRAVVDAGRDHPDPLERRVAALGELKPLGLLPAGGRI